MGKTRKGALNSDCRAERARVEEVAPGAAHAHALAASPSPPHRHAIVHHNKLAVGGDERERASRVKLVRVDALVEVAVVQHDAAAVAQTAYTYSQGGVRVSPVSSNERTHHTMTYPAFSFPTMRSSLSAILRAGFPLKNDFIWMHPSIVEFNM